MMRTLPATAVARRAPQFPGAQPAKVVRVDGSRLYVELDSARGLEVEVKWSRPHAPHTHTVTDGLDGGGSTTRTSSQPTYTAANPPAGTRCLVLFTDLGQIDAWVIAWSGWPA